MFSFLNYLPWISQEMLSQWMKAMSTGTGCNRYNVNSSYLKKLLEKCNSLKMTNTNNSNCLVTKPPFIMLWKWLLNLTKLTPVGQTSQLVFKLSVLFLDYNGKWPLNINTDTLCKLWVAESLVPLIKSDIVLTST